MKDAAFDPSERVAQYVSALQYYLQALPDGVRIVFAENSASMALVQQRLADDERIEWIDATDLDAPYHYDQQRGKGYNEWLLMHHAVTHSAVLSEAGCFFKVTGRLRVLNIAALLHECMQRDRQLRFLGDCKDHGIYDALHIHVNGHSGECRYFFSTTEFFVSEIFPHYDLLYDYDTKPAGMEDVYPSQCLAEDVMLQVCRRVRQLPHCYDRFRTQARLSGRGAHNLGPGSKFFTSTDNDSFILRFKSSLRQLLRWILPWWRC